MSFRKDVKYGLGKAYSSVYDAAVTAYYNKFGKDKTRHVNFEPEYEMAKGIAVTHNVSAYVDNAARVDNKDKAVSVDLSDPVDSVYKAENSKKQDNAALFNATAQQVFAKASEAPKKNLSVYVEKSDVRLQRKGADVDFTGGIQKKFSNDYGFANLSNKSKNDAFEAKANQVFAEKEVGKKSTRGTQSL
jgi:hypothetical protein